MNSWIGRILAVAILVVVYAATSWQPQTDEPPDAAASLNDSRTTRPAQTSVKQPTVALQTFGGYPCNSSDCSDDKAGFRWAEDHAIADPDDCTGNSGTFIEGCRVYAERARDARRTTRERGTSSV